jgi:rod shape-determining protein MreC
VHDKTVRRRRAVLALLVVLSLILISASFGSSGTGPLHAVQSGFLDIVSPIESGAGKVLTPVHDLFNWVGDVFNAADQRDKLRKQLTSVSAKYAALQTKVREAGDAAALAQLDRRAGLAADGPVPASVIVRGQSLFVSQLSIDAGSAGGVRPGDPVINKDGLVGIVSQVAADASVVQLINDSTAKAAAVDNRNGQFGVVQADPGNPNLLQLLYVSNVGSLKTGDVIVTAGSALTQHQTLFPRNVPIGTIKSLPPPGDDTGTITLTPSVDFGALGQLQVLTKVPR